MRAGGLSGVVMVGGWLGVLDEVAGILQCVVALIEFTYVPGYVLIQSEKTGAEEGSGMVRGRLFAM
jgi:hypothetical protein